MAALGYYFLPTAILVLSIHSFQVCRGKYRLVVSSKGYNFFLKLNTLQDIQILKEKNVTINVYSTYTTN